MNCYCNACKQFMQGTELVFFSRTMAAIEATAVSVTVFVLTKGSCGLWSLLYKE